MSKNHQPISSVLLVTNLVPNKMGAFEKFMLGFAERCQKSGVTAHFLVAGTPHPELGAGLARAGAVVHVLADWVGPGKTHRAGAFVKGYGRVVRSHSFDLVAFQFCLELPVLAALFSSRVRQPFRSAPRIIWHQQSEMQAPRNAVTRNFSRLRIASWFFDGVCGVYQKAGDIFRARGIAAKKIHAIYNGVDSVPISREQAAEKRRELQLQSDNVMLFSASSLIVRKNVAYMIKEFAQALATLPKLRLIIAGEGDQRENLTRLAEDLKVADCVTLLGKRSDVQALIAASDLCLLTSNSEALPFFCGETMAQGKAIISTPAGGVPEIVEDGVNGIIIKAEPGALSAQIIRLVQDEILRRRFEAAAAQTFRQQFSLEAMVDNYWRYYKLPV